MRTMVSGRCFGSARQLLTFKGVAFKFQGSAVLSNCPDQLVGRPVGELRFDLERHRHLGSDLSRQVRDYLVRNAACISAYANRVEADRPMKTPKQLRRAQSWS